MKIFLILISYLVYAAFWGRFILHAFIWYKSARQLRTGPSYAHGASLSLCLVTAIDILFFRRLFNENKLLWLGSWTFHVSFILVVLRHLNYFFYPVPSCITHIQPFGLVAGYILPVSLFYLLAYRIAGREKYISYHNFFLLGMVLLISLSGLLMRMFFSPNLVDVKGFMLGILTFRPDLLPDSSLFFIHFSLVLLLVPFLPLHIFAAPVVTMESGRREAGLRMVIHDK